MDRAEVDALCIQLQKNATGAHAHTAGKAQFYLEKLAGKPKARFSNCTQEEFASAVRQALALDKWLELGILMGRWW